MAKKCIREIKKRRSDSMKIRAEQLNVTVGDLKGNGELISEALKRAEKENIDLLVLPELVTCGYPPMDLLERKAFLERLYQLNDKIIDQTTETALLFGTVTENKSGTGRPIFNAALLAQHGKLVGEAHKSLLPTYDVFDEFRYFEPAEKVEPISFMGISLGVTICEDLWYNYSKRQYHTYSVHPAKELGEKGIDLLLNVSASPFDKNKTENRFELMSRHARERQVPVVYVNLVGANTELIFDGDSMFVNPDGKSVDRLPLFKAGFKDVVFDNQKKVVKQVPGAVQPEPMPRMRQMFEALVMGVRDYLEKTGFTSKVLLGLSGGIDSAITAVIAKEAAGAENVLAVTMPSEFSSEGSVSDSEKLADNLGVELREIAIKNIYNTYLDTLNPLFEGTEFNVAEENLQSRSRGVLLMAISNKFGHMLLNTGNKSEMAVGYCTLYGDMAGGLSVISDLYKTEVFEMCRWLNEEYYGEEVIPESIITKPPSAELRPDQKDSDSLPEYEVLDQILALYIEDQSGAQEIIQRGFERETVEKVIRLVDMTEYKRRQSPPGLRISSKAFGIGRRLPIVQDWTNQQFA